MANIDNLDIQIKASSQLAVKSLDDLIGRLNHLQTALSSVQTDGISHLANGLDSLSRSVLSLQNIDSRTFSKIARNIDALGRVNSGGVYAAANSVMSMANAFSTLSSYSASFQSIADLASAISRLGYKSVSAAIQNIPMLSTVMVDLFKNLSTAPQVSKNLIDMTNALANLAAQGRQVGTVANAMSKNFNAYSASANHAHRSSMTLARAIGTLYAKYFLLIRGVKKLWTSATNFMDFTETVNYFEVAIRKIGQSASHNWEEMGYNNAQEYADSFSERMRTLNEKMSGFSVDERGNIKVSDIYAGLGMNPNTTMQYTAMFSQIADGIGMTEEASIALSEAFVKLGADWASLRNTDFDTAYNKLASGLSGQSRALRTFGIDITQATLQELAFSIGIEKNVSEMTQAEKSYLRTIAVLEQSRVAYGDLANTISSPANQMRLLNQGLENTSTLLGSLFMPIVAKALPVLNGFVIAMQKVIITIADVLGIEMGDINTSIGGMDDAFYDFTEDVDGATDAINKFVKSARPIDELNLLNKKDGSGSGGSLDYTKMLDRFYRAIADYNKVWDESYSKMESDANKIADIILSNFDAKEFANRIKDLVETMDKLYTSAKPLLHGFLSGFAEVFKGLGEVALGALGITADVLADIDSDNLEKAGKAMGKLTASMIVYKKVSDTATSIANVVTGGKGGNAAAVGGIGTLIAKLKTTLSNGGKAAAGSFLTSFGLNLVNAANTPVVMHSLSGIVSDIDTKIAELTESKFGTKFKKAIQGAVGGILPGAIIGNPLVAGVGAVMGSLGYAMGEDLLGGLQDGFESVSKGLQISEKPFYELGQTPGQAIVNGLVDGFKKKIKNASVTDMEKEVKDAFESASGSSVSAVEKNGIDIALSLAKGFGIGIADQKTPIKNQFDDFLTNSIVNPVVKIGNKIYFGDTLKQNFQNALKEIKAPVNDIVSYIQKSFNFGIELDVDSALRDFNKRNLIIDFKPSVKKYATGGFPEDGWFRASHGEIMGSFDNGQSVVANNMQITQGIAQAVKSAILEANGMSSGNVVVQIDGKEVFSVVRKEAETYQRRTGQFAF